MGKSSTAVNLALALAAEGRKSAFWMPIFTARQFRPCSARKISVQPRRTAPYGADYEIWSATNSIGYLVTDDNAMVWRGPMASKALMQMLQETLWPDLDYLVLDMPPGTGDIQLTLAQNIPVTGAVVVTTPQDIALIDAKKAS